MKYSDYKNKLLNNLIAEAKKISPNLQPGVWAATGLPKEHILPLVGTNTRENRAIAIKKHLGFDVRRALPDLNGLHRFSHHLNSSQLLCMMFFSKLLDEKLQGTVALKGFIRAAFGITISEKAKCHFEYTQQAPKEFPEYQFTVENKTGYEGTSFDCHIEDGETEIFFETKLSEEGFGNAPNNEKHIEKAKQYIELLPQKLKRTPEEFLANYQIFRNVIRASAPDKYVVFITDGNTRLPKRKVRPSPSIAMSYIRHGKNWPKNTRLNYRSK